MYMVSESNTLPMKHRLMEALEDLPDDATFDEAIERLYIVYNVEVGLAQADQGMLIPHEQVKKSIQEWLR
jgi:predicted transcriptional regulator